MTHHNQPVEALKKAEESFIGNTLTLVAIIEGVALVLLAERANEFIHEFIHEYHSVLDWIIHLSYIFISFINIIATTYLYVSQLSLFRRHSTIYDVVFPYIVGGVQIVQLHFFDNLPYWWLCLVLLYMLGIYGFKKNKILISIYARKIDLPVYYRKAVHDLISNFDFLIRASILYCIGSLLITMLLFTIDIYAWIPALCLLPVLAGNIHTFYRLDRSQKKLIAHFKELPEVTEKNAVGN